MGGPAKAEYLGDGVYVSWDGYQLRLMANDHLNPTDQIFLEPSVFDALGQYVKRIEESTP